MGRDLFIAPFPKSKRIFDVLFSSLGLLLALPLIVLISLAILAEDGGPVLYVQERVGKGGRRFRLYKFRSMRRGAEAETGPVLSSRHDPRVTRVGSILRATALDELPQLWNILRGDMSVVGPRAERPEFVEEFEKTVPGYGLRHRVPPGLTGPAQVFGHYGSPPGDKLRWDLEYIRSWSFRRDLELIWKSFLLTFTARWQERESHFRGDVSV